MPEFNLLTDEDRAKIAVLIQQVHKVKKDCLELGESLQKYIYFPDMAIVTELDDAVEGLQDVLKVGEYR